jgi:Ca2+-transporting ATPase
VIHVLHTAVKGRARYKVNGLYGSQALKCHLESTLARRTGIRWCSASTLTGNILVFFHPDTSAAEIATLLVALVAEYQKVTAPGGNGFSVHPKTNGAPAPNPTAQPDPALPGRSAIRRALAHATEQPGEAWHCLDAATIMTALQTSPVAGLSSAAAQERLQRYGPNLPPESVPRSGWSILLEQFVSLPVALLGAAAGISLLTGGLADALVIAGVVAINAVIGYVTESQSEKTIHSLKSLVRPSAVAWRDGQACTIRAEEVVPGDILVLRPGSYIVADARLVEIQRLSVDESALTGESLPVGKTTAALPTNDIPLADRHNMVYTGTLVTGGQGLAVVVATGQYTGMGRIQALVGEAEPPDTPLERQLSQMSRQLVLLGGTLCGLVFGIGLLRGYGMLEMFKTSISLAVAAVPEGLPTVATTVLALGIRTMRQHHVLIRRLDAVETLGSVQTICLDKTGTLTRNQMTVVAVYTGGQRLAVTDGEFCRSEDGKRLNPYTCDELLRLLHVAVLCSEVEIVRRHGEYVLQGSSTENALLQMAISAGVDAGQLRAQYPLLHIDHRAENQNFMRTLHANDRHGPLLAVKGSPSEVLAMCDWQVQDGVLQPLTEADRLALELENERMAGAALRVLGAAYRDLDTTADAAQDMHGLIWLGLVGMVDPPRPGVRNVMADFHQAGIDTIMITGDQSPTAYAVGKELSLSRSEQLEILDSTHLTNIKPEVMTALASRVHVFARVSPSHKLQIVQALQRAGKVVAMTGDGINDGPALKAADIGIAMGNTGTDVAREVADVVLEDDSLETMIIAISHGRTIYNNIRKSVHFLLSSNLSEIMIMTVPLSLGLGQPLNAMQLLWINLLTDIAPGLALAMEPPEPDVLHRPPRNAAEPILQPADFKRITVESAVLSMGALEAYGYGLLRYGMGPHANTLAFMSLTMGQLLHAVSCRSTTHSLFDTEPLPANPTLTLAVGGSLVLQLLAILVPGLRSLLDLTPLTLLDSVVVGQSAILPLVVNELIKKLSRGT